MRNIAFQKATTTIAASVGACLCLIATCRLCDGQAARLSSSATPAALSSAPRGTPADAAARYLISQDDELDVQVLDVPEASGVFRVSPTGGLTLPLISQPIPALGLTLEQLSGEIAKDLRSSGMVSYPRVTVSVKSSRSHAVTIAGAVKRPQLYPVFSKITLLDAISQAEGLADDAGDRAIITRGPIAKRVLRANTSGKSAAEFRSSLNTVTVDLRRLLEDGDPACNVDLYPGDRVTVQRAGIVYVVGAVNKAGGFTLNDDREQMTVLKAVALAENLKSTAIAKKAVIVRKYSSLGKDEEIPVDVQKILRGRAPDRKLVANDILFIPDSASKRALHRAGEAAAEAASLVVGYRVP